MSFQEARDLYRDFLPASWRPFDHGCFGNIRGHGETDAAQKLYALGDFVHELVLLTVMLIEEQMKLIERMPGDLPVVLFVHVAKRHGIGNKLVQIFCALCADLFVQGDRQFRDLAEPGKVFLITHTKKEQLLHIVANHKPGDPFKLDDIMEQQLPEENIKFPFLRAQQNASDC